MVHGAAICFGILEYFFIVILFGMLDGRAVDGVAAGSSDDAYES